MSSTAGFSARNATVNPRWAGIFIFFVLGFWQPHGALAGDVANIITDLYGGDGIQLSAAISPFHDAHFTESGASNLAALSGLITNSASIISLNSAVTGFTFDVVEGIPVRSTESLGPILTERAATVGKGRMNLGLQFSRSWFTKFEGDDLDDLQVIFEHDTGGTTGCPGGLHCDDIVLARVDLELEQDILAFIGTYGATENWDIGIVFPLVYVRAEANASAIVVLDPLGNGSGGVNHGFGGDSGDSPIDENLQEVFGIGDVVLRTKYNLSDLLQTTDDPVIPNLGVLGQVSLATGDEDDLLGLGETSFLGLLIVSKQFDWFSPHVNAGYEITTGDSALDNLRYAVGFDVRLHERFTGAVDLIGRWHPDGDGSRDNIDLSVGAKWDPFGKGDILNANFLIPVNKDSGLRTDVTWSVGIDLAF